MLVQQIKKLDRVGKLTKKQKIIKGITECILDDVLEEGDMLPSVNDLSGKLGYSRETVVKAYKILKDRGILNAKHGLGYFISNSATDQKLTIALVMYGFQSFQQTFYNTLRKSLGEDFQVDVFFHHNNRRMYKTILNDVKAQYGLYVVAPIQTEESAEMLCEFPTDKLLLVDRYQFVSEKTAHITQEFETSLTTVFNSLEERFRDFEKIILFYRDDIDYQPKGIFNAFQNFCKEKHISFEHHKEYESSLLKKNVVYFTIGDSDLWALLKDCKGQGLIPGKDIGILSHNESPVKEIIEGGITTFSTDFTDMAVKAADFIKERKIVKEIVPSKLIRRQSL